jgi:signal transduction histidine kinase
VDQVRFQERLQDAAVISGRLAHGFDNILTGILGFGELSLTQTPSEAPTYAFMEEVVRAAQLGVQFTQHLHVLHRCSTATSGPAAVDWVAGEEAVRLRGTLEAAQKLEVAVPANLPQVAIDAEVVRQVLGRLLDNAREALGTSVGTITLAARELATHGTAGWLGNPQPGSAVELTITDTGPGLSPEARERLFVEPFFTTKPRQRGLGLAIVYRTLLAHKGGLRLECGPNRGTRVRVLLPLSA